MFSLKMKIAIFSIVIAAVTSEFCAPYGSIRLQGGDSNRHGRVEICLNRRWRAVSGHHWEDTDAQVACKQLGFPGTGAVALNSSNKEDQFYGFKCHGDEKRLIDCPLETAGNTHRDAGVITHRDAGVTTHLDAEVKCTEGNDRVASVRGPLQDMAISPHAPNEMKIIDADGNYINVRVAIPDLLDIHFTANMFSIIRGHWAWYRRANYRGNANVVSYGGVARTESVPIIRSVKPLIGEIILYANFNYTGRSLVLTESVPNLAVYTFNDEASSVRVISGKWRLWKNFYYGSRSHTTSGNPESFRRIPTIPNDSLSSVQFMPEA